MAAVLGNLSGSSEPHLQVSFAAYRLSAANLGNLPIPPYLEERLRKSHGTRYSSERLIFFATLCQNLAWTTGLHGHGLAWTKKTGASTGYRKSARNQSLC